MLVERASPVVLREPTRPFGRFPLGALVPLVALLADPMPAAAAILVPMPALALIPLIFLRMDRGDRRQGKPACKTESNEYQRHFYFHIHSVVFLNAVLSIKVATL